MDKRIALIIIIVLSFFSSFGQEWFAVKFNFKFKNIRSENDLAGLIFSFVEGSRTDGQSLFFNKKDNQLELVYITMGGGQPVLIIEKKHKRMSIDLNNYAENSEIGMYSLKDKKPYTIRTRFVSGNFKLRKFKLVKYNNSIDDLAKNKKEIIVIVK